VIANPLEVGKSMYNRRDTLGIIG